MFAFEKMDVYGLAVDVAREVRSARFPWGDADLKDQARRAAQSMVLNLAEGRMRGGKAAANHYRIALGSAGELYAALDLVDLPQTTEWQARLRRVGAMLRRMAQHPPT